MEDAKSRRREPDTAAFHRLLSWLDEGDDSHGERYLDVRERLVHYFARRRCLAPDDLADETLNRVARRLDETGSIDDVQPAHYCYIVARFVLLESLRERERLPAGPLPDREVGDVRSPAQVGDSDAERTAACLERCLEACSPQDRRLILDYYNTASASPKVQRQQLAGRLGLTANALAIRACRIRSRLEDCVRACRGR